MRKFTLLLAGASLFSAAQLSAQDAMDAAEPMAEEKTPLVLSGSVDTYFRQNLTTNNYAGGTAVTPVTSFANQPGFALGMANIIAQKEQGKVGFVADLVFGQRGQDAVFNAAGSNSIVNQLYAYWNASDKVTLTLGNFNTYLGYEVISPTGNFNYSTSHMFSFGPFSHTGLKADFALTDGLSATLAVMNPTDLTDVNPGNSYILGAQVAYETEELWAGLNVRYGDENGKATTEFGANNALVNDGTTFQIDLTATYDATPELHLGINATYLNTAVGDTVGLDSDGNLEVASVDPEVQGGSKFGGVAVYANYDLSENVSIGARYEHFEVYRDGAGLIPLEGGSFNQGQVQDITLSANIKCGDLTIIPELRADVYSADLSVPDVANSGKDADNWFGSFLVAAVYSF